MKRILFLLIVSVIALQSCTDATASSQAKGKPPKKTVTTYKVMANGETYKNLSSVATDSSGCISFHVPAKKGGCGCSGTPAKDVKICGSYSIESTTE